MRQTFNPSPLAAPGGAYSHVVRRGELVFIAGQIGLSPDGNLVGHDVASQTRQTLTNLGIALQSAAATFDDVCAVTVYLANIERDFASFNRTYSEFFGADPPTRATVQAALARHDVLIEITAVAVTE